MAEIEEAPRPVNFDQFVRDLRILIQKYSIHLPWIQVALIIIFNEKKENK